MAVSLVGIGNAFHVEARDEAASRALRVGVLPDQQDGVLRKRYQPLLRYLAKNVQLEVEMVIPRTYDDLVDLFGQGEIDIAFFGGLTFLQAHTRYSAVPLVMRDIDLRFRSYFLARADGEERNIKDFKGRRFAFGSRQSTSGHLMPRHFLDKKGIDAEAFFGQVEFSGAHDKSATWVGDGRVDLSVANAAIVDQMFADGRLSTDEVQVVWRTPSYPDYVWAATRTLPVDVRQNLIMAFLQLSLTDEAQASLLQGLHAGGFLPARISDFQELRVVADRLGLL